MFFADSNSGDEWNFFKEQDRSRTVALKKVRRQQTTKEILKQLIAVLRKIMQSEFLKMLWVLRFQEMRISEGQAAWKYQEILDQLLISDCKNEEVVKPLQ